VRGYAPRLLDELGAAGEVLWVGQGTLGKDDGRIALYRPDRLALLVAERDADAERPMEWLHELIREHLGARGASFYRDLLAAAASGAVRAGRRAPTQRELLDALWDLVWAGEVTNDTFAPLRALRWPRTGREGTRPRHGVGARLGPPEAAGRWSLLRDALATSTMLTGSEPTATERRHALALRLLERQGVVTRDGVAGESIPGGFGTVYPVLREMEERGRLRRGYFVEGLGGAQFALPGAVDRLRAERADPGGDREAGRTLLLAASDPAQPYGAALPWPREGEDDRRPLQRAAGAYVVLHDGEPVLYLERGGKSVLTFPPFAMPAAADAAIAALRSLVTDGRVRSLQLERVDGVPVAESLARDRLAAAGFRQTYRGWTLRAETAAR
jgi:ATP-dependent Lhr-like helicase